MEKSNSSLREKLEHANQYWQLDIPRPKEEIEERLKVLTKSASIALIEYLKLDTYLLVQNLAQVTNKDNVSEVIAYRDGAIGRNNALIERLSKVAWKNNEFFDRMEWEIKGTKKKEEAL